MILDGTDDVDRICDFDEVLEMKLRDGCSIIADFININHAAVSLIMLVAGDLVAAEMMSGQGRNVQLGGCWLLNNKCMMDARKVAGGTQERREKLPFAVAVIRVSGSLTHHSLTNTTHQLYLDCILMAGKVLN